MDRKTLDGDRIFLIEGFLSAEECHRLIHQGESIGYEPAGVGDAAIPSLRNNSRVIVDAPDLAALWFDRARPFLPEVEGETPLGFNPRFRFYRYDPTESFAPHFDGSIRLGEGESRLTFLVYLNEDCQGGGTHFYHYGGAPHLSVEPKAGTALAFEHLQLHEGAVVVQGRKYAIRTDILYGRG